MSRPEAKRVERSGEAFSALHQAEHELMVLGFVTVGTAARLQRAVARVTTTNRKAIAWQ